MTPIELARRCAELNQPEEAKRAYTLALKEDLAPEEELEAASYLFFAKGDYKIPFTRFVSLFNRGLFQSELLDLMGQAFYFPNVDKLQKQYEKNKKALSDYPYFFRRDFPDFADLPIWFFPFDNQGYIPYYPGEARFGDYVDVNDPVVDRWFFKDLSKPILADDVFSQYQLEYLNDNVRKSEWVAMDNHIYLHYTNYQTFCAWLQVLNFKKLLHDEKLVFLMEDEVKRYPIDFQLEYGIDYSACEVKPIGIREINRLIWHTQLCAHNGGDFFNEVLYDHPNLLAKESVMFAEARSIIEEAKADLRNGKGKGTMGVKLSQLKNPTDKDFLVALYMGDITQTSQPDPTARIAPALMLQPHFSNIYYQIEASKENQNGVTLSSKQYEQLRRSPMLRGFKYIKTFAPLRRPTTSYAATVRFVDEQLGEEWENGTEEGKKPHDFDDNVSIMLLNRGYLINPWDRFYRDSCLVRFEDGKLNPKATFTALAEFLDIPYSESMTYCSGPSGRNPESLPGNVRGFDPVAVFRTYPEYGTDEERAYIEYFLRDIYEAYGYDFQYYKGEPVDENWVREKIAHFTCLDSKIRATKKKLASFMLVEKQKDEQILTQQEEEKAIEEAADMAMEAINERRLKHARCMLAGLCFVNREGQPLQMMKALELDPDLLEQPLYH